MKCDILCFILLLSVFSARADEDQPTSNLVRFEKLFSLMASETDSFFNIKSHSSVLIQGSAQQTSAGWFFRSSLIQFLQNEVERIVWQNPQDVDCMLEFQVPETSVQYTKVNHDGVERKVSATASLVFKIGNEISASQTFKKSLLDTIKINDLQQIENSLYPFTIGEKPESGAWQKWLEPGLLIGLSAGIIYMFYSFRSK
ncbi:hypothetical protein GF406_24575 [candidate division KSB1 bacterium]|nr:hypothetical protein [candidate division KSB1 bacterium]